MNLEQNLRSPDNPYAAFGRSFAQEANLQGIVITSVLTYRISKSEARPFRVASYRVHGTLMQIWLADPLPPSGVVNIDVSWYFRVPAEFWGAGRKRYAEGLLYQIGQWYPRMVVYDDVHGWNTDQYLGRDEFYLEYGDFDYSVTVPSSYTVAGSGVPTTEAEKLTPTQHRRLMAAATSSIPVDIITREEAAHLIAAASESADMRTWRFQARNVRDVAWSVGPNPVWRAMSSDGVLFQALYTTTVPAFWDEALGMTRHTVRFYSDVYSAIRTR